MSTLPCGGTPRRKHHRKGRRAQKRNIIHPVHTVEKTERCVISHGALNGLKLENVPWAAMTERRGRRE